MDAVSIKPCEIKYYTTIMFLLQVWLPHSITTLLQGIPHPQHSVENFKVNVQIFYF